MTLDAPLLAVVGGSTGAGKSTLVNSLVGTRVTEPGRAAPDHPLAGAGAPPRRRAVVRPGPAAARPRAGHRARPTTPPRCSWWRRRAMPPGLAILDAPDIDSVEERNRVLAAQLLAAADLWLFVTSAARYADQVPWDFLRKAAERSTAVAIVLDRTPAEAVETVTTHLARMLASRGLKDSPLFTVDGGRGLATTGLLPAVGRRSRSGSGCSRWPTTPRRARRGRAADPRRRRPHARPAYARGGRRRRPSRPPPCAGCARTPTTAYDDAIAAIAEATADGTLLRGEVLARWQEFVGTGELLKSLETRVGWLRDRRRQRDQGQAAAGRAGHRRRRVRPRDAASSSTPRRPPSGPRPRGSSTRPASAAARRRRGPRPRLARLPRAGPSASVRDWQHDVLEMVRTEGADKRTTARFLAFGVNGLVGRADGRRLRPHRRASTGAEAGIAGGSAVLGQKLLEAVFGDQAVRRLAERARRDLEPRVSELLDAERGRYTDLLDCLGIEPEAPERLREPPAGSTTCASPRHGVRSRSRCGLGDRRPRLVAHAPPDREGAMTSLLEGARKLVTRGSDLGARIEGLERGRRGCARPARRRARRRGRRGRRPGRRPAAALRRPHRRRDRRRDRLRQVLDVQRADRARALRGRRTPPDHVVGHRLRVGRARAPTSCSTGSASRRATRSPATRCSTHGRARTATSRASCCSTCPTTTPPRSPTTSRSTGWSSSPTCWSGCSTRRSTPTPRSTTATSRRSPPTTT